MFGEIVGALRGLGCTLKVYESLSLRYETGRHLDESEHR